MTSRHDFETRRGTYKGPAPLIKGYKANVRVYRNGQALAQFDEMSSGFGDGWHSFAASDFELDRPVVWE